MSTDAQSARDDIAFLKSLVGDDGGSGTRQFGLTYFLSGLIYGGQMIGHALVFVGILPSAGLWPLAIGVGPTVIFIPLIIWANIRASHTRQTAGPVSRAVLAVFGTIGLANVVLALIVGSVAWREQNITTWLIFPCCVFVLQGICWLFAMIMRRKSWFGLVAAGWMACGIAMALSVTSLGWFILFGGLGLWLCMALPGLVMMRNSAG